MQKIRLFSQYNLEALLLKATKEINDKVAQWADHYFDTEQLPMHIDALKQSQHLDLPPVDFLNGRQVMIDRIYPASVYQPGLKNNSKVRVSVLTFQYPFAGQMYLLGCCPATDVPEAAGEWYFDSLNKQIIVEYVEYEKYPRKTINAHQSYIASVQASYKSLQDEFVMFNNELDRVIESAVKERIRENDEFKRMLSSLK